ncbi:LPS export ABC transporter periplasmic protein LptC [Rickettsiales endosymbiont of Stachyamoeba lipophora]|uniref:LPS export ABC transporter periplasmic protein LptC n=1 Tax=Rickettsiales endosymbiont of Stachyamoeba lipophora TaxID=2486578 RepID=UPI000F64BD2D|nr:LPS export ABC transporter periplasmic protein LptC [Rickettsiales endosymbiont of Stachyamoeba lipophora]AZL14999.1 LPS export ABC transporter periplasmic protein LptC [Rickettsiales endosymbiont of Stachyamoeba lipophora]
MLNQNAKLVKTISLLLLLSVTITVAILMISNAKNKLVLKTVAFNKEETITQKVINPFYTTLDSKKRPFNISAVEAVKIDEDNLKLDNVNAALDINDQKKITASSDQGIYNSKEDKIYLSGHVRVVTNDGSSVSTESADLDIKNSLIFSNKFVEVKTESSYLTAQNGFVITNNGKNISFKGPVKMKIWKRS